MSVASRIQEIETHIGDIYDTLEVGGTDLTDLNKNIVNINSSLKDRYKYFLNNGVEVIWNNWEKVIGEGTEFTLENTIQAPMKINLKGNTYQKSTTGKNMFDINATKTDFNIYLYKYEYQLKPNTQYTISSNAPVTTTANIYANSKSSTKKVCAGTPQTITSDSNGNFYILVRHQATTEAGTSDVYSKILDGTYWLQIEEGSSATDYEEYTGGIASPNPDYPQDIQVVSGDNNITICGKNLAYTGWAEDFVTRINDSTKAKLEVVDGKNCLFYTASAGYQEYDTKYMFKTNWKENTQYTFRLNVKPSNANVFNLTIAYTDGTSQRIDATTSANTWSTYTKFTSYANKTIKYLRVNWSTGSDYIDLDTFMVYEGTETLPYEPYQKESYPINLGDIELGEIGDYQDGFIRNSGKNLLDRSACEENKILVWATGLTTSNTDSLVSDYIEINVNEKIISSFKNQVMFYDKNKEYLGCLQADGTTIAKTTGDYFSSFTIPNNEQIKYIKLGYGSSANDNLNMTIQSIMSNKGEILLPYEPYGTGKWYLHEEIRKVVLDNTNINEYVDSVSSTSHSILRIQLPKTNLGWKNVWNNGIALMNNYHEITATSDIKHGTFASNFQVGYINIFDSRVTDITTARNILIGTEIYIAKATPTYTEITDTTLLSQLEAVYKAISHDDQTNISQVNNDMPFKLEVTALKNI